MRVKYIRVSTEEQNTERQHEDSLKMYIDKISGTVAFEDRPAASKLLKDIEERNKPNKQERRYSNNGER